MIPGRLPRTRKTNSLQLPPTKTSKNNKENKENCGNNNGLPPLGNLAKVRGNFAVGNLKPLKVLRSVTINAQQELELMDKRIKQEYIEILRKDYSSDILMHMLSKDPALSDSLATHQITPHLRAKMVDWMIEVLSSYKMSEQTFFRSVRYMDKFFKNTIHKLQPPDLHLIGVTAMFTASKYQEIYPLKLAAMIDKICRKKFEPEDIMEMERQMLLALNFQLQQVTALDIIGHVLSEIQPPISQKSAEYLHKVSIYLAKMAMHSVQLAWLGNGVLAAAVIFLSFKTVEQIESTFKCEEHLDTICTLTKTETSQLMEVSQSLLNLAQNFHIQYPSLNNLRRYNNAEYEE